MPFIYSIIFLGFINLFAASRANMRGDRLASVLHTLAFMSSSLMVTSAMYLAGVLPVLIPADSVNYTVVDALISGMLTTCIFTWKLSKINRGEGDQSLGSWRSGLSVCALVAGLYVCFTAIDHWWFFRDSEHSGVTNARFMGADDVQCGDALVLVRIDGEDAVYRCPTSIYLGPFTSNPFVPWPSYEEGRSHQLKFRIDRIMKDAVVESHDTP